jgi:hypothetical protein
MLKTHTKWLTALNMIFFKWYGKNIDNFYSVPEFHKDYKYIRTIGISVFNKKESTDEHYGPLRTTLRVLYNINNLRVTAILQVSTHSENVADCRNLPFPS